MALWLLSRIGWIAFCAIVTYGFHGTDENDGAKYLKEIGYLVKSAEPETLATITDHEVVSTTMKDLPEFASLGETDPPSPSEDDDDDDVADIPDICEDAKLDTVTEVKNGKTYAFKGDLFWEVGSCNIPTGYPKSISAEWNGLPGNLDASFTFSYGKTYFFKGSQYWRFVNKKMDKGYPKPISERFQGIPDNVEAAIVWRGNSKIYFFKGTEYWCFDFSSDPPVDSRYPRPIGEGWSSLLANGIDAAFGSKGRHKYFFFKDETYYRYNAEIDKVDEVFPPYPLPTAAVWFGCY